MTTIGGQVSRKMLERHSHIRMGAKRTALESLWGRRLEGYATKDEMMIVYTGLSHITEKDTGAKKLEVATVPG